MFKQLVLCAFLTEHVSRRVPLLLHPADQLTCQALVDLRRLLCFQHTPSLEVDLPKRSPLSRMSRRIFRRSKTLKSAILCLFVGQTGVQVLLFIPPSNFCLAHLAHNWSFTGKSYRAILSTPSSPPQDDRARSPMSARSGNATPVHGLAPPPPSSMAFSPGPTQPMPLPGPGMQANMLQPGMPYPPMYYQQMPPQQYRYPGGPGGQPGMPPQMGMSPTPGMPYPQQQQQQFMGFPPGKIA